MYGESEPLVSIGVVTFRSSKYIVETLESAKNQSYKNIELIISDDCSSDNTIEICHEWIEKNAERFVRTAIITSPINTGISANCNRVVMSSKGKYLKLIAGDDTLEPTCVEDLLYEALKRDSDILFSRMRPFGDNVHTGIISCKNLTNVFKYLNGRDFLILLTHINFLPAPCSFIKRDLYEKIGLYNESIPFIEDWPFWVKALSQGFAINYLDKITVNYRIHGEAISQKSTHISEMFRQSKNKAVQYAYETGSKLGFLEKCHYKILWISYFRYSTITRLLALLNWLNPFTYQYKRIKYKFNKLLIDE